MVFFTTLNIEITIFPYGQAKNTRSHGNKNHLVLFVEVGALTRVDECLRREYVEPSLTLT